jgi:hypothetical protein
MRGDHQKYRDFLCYIIRNAKNFTALECGKLSHLLMRILEEDSMSRVTFIDSKGNKDVTDIMKKHSLTKKKNGRHTFCKGDKIVYNGWAISNTDTNTILLNALNERGRNNPIIRLEIIRANEAIASIIIKQDAIRYNKETIRNMSIGTAAAAAGEGGMEAAKGGSNRSRRAPIRRKSENRRTSRRRNKTRKYYKK